MAFKMAGFSAFTLADSPEKQKEIKTYIKNNMNKMSDAELSKNIRSMSSGDIEYNWNNETGEVEAHKIKK